MRPPPLVPRGGQTQNPLMELLRQRVHEARNHRRVNPRTGYNNAMAGAAGSVNHLVGMATLARMLQGAR